MFDKKENNKKYQEKNKAEIKKQRADHYQCNRIRIRATQKKYYLENKERIHKEYRRKNKDVIKKQMQEWFQKNKIVISVRAKKWRIKNPQRLKTYKHNRRLLNKNAGMLTLQIIQKVYEDNIKQYGTLTCYLCLQPIFFGEDNLEHKTPLTRGGTNKYSNLGIACEKCNHQKYNKTEKEYMGGV